MGFFFFFFLEITLYQFCFDRPLYSNHPSPLGGRTTVLCTLFLTPVLHGRSKKQNDTKTTWGHISRTRRAVRSILELSSVSCFTTYLLPYYIFLLLWIWELWDTFLHWFDSDSCIAKYIAMDHGSSVNRTR